MSEASDIMFDLGALIPRFTTDDKSLCSNVYPSSYYGLFVICGANVYSYESGFCNYDIFSKFRFFFNSSSLFCTN